MKKLTLIFMTVILTACGAEKATTPKIDDFKYSVDKFADIEILRYRVPDFENLSLKQKELVYYLNQAALEGRDILYDQNNKYNLCIRRTLEAIYLNYPEDKNSPDFQRMTTYLKRVWMGNGIHHHYSEDKFVPEFSEKFFMDAVRSIDPATLPLLPGERPNDLINKLLPIIFDPTIYPKRTNQADGVDLIQTSGNNYYSGVTQKEVEDFYGKMKNPKDSTPVSFGLNSKLVKVNGNLVEETYKVG
ncbi:MAG: dihydrofolate reductase, partial [Paludibacter sp.]